MQVLIEPLLRQRSLKSITPSYLPTHGKFENLCLVSVAPMVCVSHMFVYDAVDINKIFSKTAIIHLCASDCRAKTRPWSICQSMVNIESQIPTL